MTSDLKRIGISGGTFDPIHHGHLIIAEEIRAKFSLQKVVFIPSGNPPHKTGTLVSSSVHRYNMVCEAIKTNPFFEASPIEVQRKGYSYTVDTLKELKETYGSGSSLFFITGADVILELMTWKDYESIFSMCELVAVLRPGFNREDIAGRIEYLGEKFNAVIHLAEAPLIGISSTFIRECVRSGKSIKYLVPEGVEEYILKHGLYR